MDAPSPRRELQGPRPAPLKIQKQSHKIKKPPLPPHHSHHPPPPQPRAGPVIIYTLSPKVIHANPADFMALVQQLTGADSHPSSYDAGAPSPAAKVATFEKSTTPAPLSRAVSFIDTVMEETATSSQYLPSGILSPMPSSLPPISPGYFLSPSFDPSMFLMSPGSNFMESGGSKFLPSPNFMQSGGGGDRFLSSPGAGGFLSTPVLPSPGALLDLFNQLRD